jgi:hypothetical protein
MGKTRNACESPVRKTEEKGPLGITRGTWEDDINMNLKGRKRNM